MVKQTYADNVDANGKVFKTIGDNIREGAKAGELKLEHEISALQAGAMKNANDIISLKEGLANLKIKKINVADYGIKGNGEDVADAVLDLIERFKWKNVNLYFPSGTYKFSKPVRFYGRVNVIGEPFAFTATERNRTVFDFSLIDSQESETYCVTCDYFTLFKNITLYSDAYKFTEDRKAFLSDRNVMPFVATVNKQNISGISF